METLEFKIVIKKSIAKAVISCGSQEKLAKRANISQGAISKYLRGEAMPTGVTAKKLSYAVDGNQSPADFAPHIF